MGTKKWLRKREQERREEGVETWRDFTALVLIVTPFGIPLVRDLRKAISPLGRLRQVFWRLPGGKAKLHEEPLETAVREIKEKTGAILDPRGLTIMWVEKRVVADFYVFLAEVSDVKFSANGEKGETVCLFSPEQILSLNDFESRHRRAVERKLSFLFTKGKRPRRFAAV